MIVLNELVHLIASFLAGFLAWKLWGNFKLAVFAALLGGFLIDFDHLFNYFMAFGFDFNLEWFIQGRQFLVTEKLYVLFHGWEYVIIAMVILMVIIFSKRDFVKSKVFLLAFSLAMFFHLIADSTMNDGLNFRTYLLVHRAKNNFEIERLVTADHYQKFLKEKEEIKSNHENR